MSVSGDTQFAAVESQVWDTQVLQARYSKAAIMPHVLNRSTLVAESGQVVHIPIKPVFVGGTVGSDGTFTPEQVTLTDVQVNVNTWKQVSIEITDKAGKQAVVTLTTEMPSQFGEKLATFYDIDLANLYNSLTGIAVGSKGTPVQFDETAATAAVLGLRRNDIPLEDMSWILPPEAYYLGWLLKERFTNAMTTGFDKSVIQTNYRQPILGIPAYESTLLAGSVKNADATITAPAGGIAGMLIHEQAFAIAMQTNNKYEQVRGTPAGRLTTIIVAQNLYGVVVCRADHGCPIFIGRS